ncbi:MAG TPA: DUF5666 domain-containing protein [Acidobacteriaceae bacterium]|nr:DUF5666 domain-containing protein [Acidobacteriaceae bacterium]
MHLLNPRLARLALGCLLASVCALPVLAQNPSQPGASQPDPSQQDPSQQGGGRRGYGMGAGGGMGGFLGGGGTAGTVTAIAGTEISLKNEQGEIYKVQTGPNTHIRKDREEARFSDIHVGDVLVAGGNLDDQAKSLGAVFIMVLSSEQAARMEKMRADFGKTWTAGKITDVNTDALTVTVERPDKVAQTIAVDENTTFRKHTEDITFPDIKVGDMVRATGAVQGSTFLATTLTVMGPGGRGPGRPGQPGPNQPSQNQPSQNQPGPNQPGPNQPAPPQPNAAPAPAPLSGTAPTAAPQPPSRIGI